MNSIRTDSTKFKKRYECPMCGLSNTSLRFIEKETLIYEKCGDLIKFKNFYSSRDIKKINGLRQVKLNKDCLSIYCRICQYEWVIPTIKDERK